MDVRRHQKLHMKLFCSGHAFGVAFDSNKIECTRCKATDVPEAAGGTAEQKITLHELIKTLFEKQHTTE